MNKKELFDKYGINETHGQWNPMVDNWMSVEVYRIMNDGELPDTDKWDTKYITAFLDACNRQKDSLMLKLMSERNDAGSLYLTAKRMVYRYADQILKDASNE